MGRQTGGGGKGHQNPLWISRPPSSSKKTHTIPIALCWEIPPSIADLPFPRNGILEEERWEAEGMPNEYYHHKLDFCIEMSLFGVHTLQL